MTPRGGSQSGYSLVEIMVVLLIIALLLAIAVPSFLGSSSAADDRAVQQNLSTALATTLAQYTNAGDFSQLSTTTLMSAEPSLKFVDSATAAVGPHAIGFEVPVATPISQVLVLASGAADGICWFVMSIETAAGMTLFSSSGWKGGTLYAKTKTSTCTAAGAPAAQNKWASTFGTAP